MKTVSFAFILALCTFTVFSRESVSSFDIRLSALKGEKKLDLLLQAASGTGMQPGKIIFYAKMANELAVELKNRKKSAEACFLLSGAYLDASKPDSALIFAQRSLDLFRVTGNPAGMIKALNKTGLAFLNQSNTDMAEKIFIQAFSDCNLYLKKDPSSRQLRDLEAEVFNNLSLTYVKQGNNRKAKEKLLQYSKKPDFRSTFSGMIIQRSLAGVYQNLGEYDSSLFFYNNALGLALSLNDPLSAGKIYSDLGSTSYYMGKSSDALDYYEKAREILESVNDKPQMAKLYNNMASTYILISYYEKATKYFLESARLKEELADSDGLAATYNNLGLVYFDWDNNKMTRYFLEKAISINLKRKNKKYLATNFTAMGDLSVDLKQADSALFYYKKSLELKTEMGNKYGMVVSLHSLGDLYAGLLTNEPRAMEYYAQALSLAGNIGSGSEIASLNLSLGEIMFRKGKLAEAYAMFRQAFDYANQENSLELVQKCSRYLTEISILAGDKARAKEYFSSYRVAGDSLFSENKAKVILEMQTRFQTEKKEQENLLLQKTNGFQISMINFLIGIAILLSILGIVIFTLYRQKSRAFRQIVRKNQELVNAEKHIEDTRSMSRQRDHAVNLPPDNEIENTTLGLLVKFNRLMENEKLYLEAGLTVDDVCRKINTNRSYLSQMISDNFNLNFNGFINELRIKEARRLLADSKYDHLSIEGIGAMAGFNTKVTFHAIFKRQIGITRFYFRNSIQRNKNSRIE